MIQRIQGLASLSSPEKEFGTGSSVGSKIQKFKDSKDSRISFAELPSVGSKDSKIQFRQDG